MTITAMTVTGTKGTITRTRKGSAQPTPARACGSGLVYASNEAAPVTDDQNNAYGPSVPDQPPITTGGQPQQSPYGGGPQPGAYGSQQPGYYGGPPPGSYGDPNQGGPQQGGPPPGYYGGPPQSGPPPGYYGPPPGYPVAGYYAAPRTNSKAGWALGLGIAGFFLCPLTGIAAVVIGGQAKDEIRRTREQGEGMATAGVVLGWILCGLMALGVVFFLFAVVLAGAGSGS